LPSSREAFSSVFPFFADFEKQKISLPQDNDGLEESPNEDEAAFRSLNFISGAENEIGNTTCLGKTGGHLPSHH
jgi:hypothetical protein